MRGATRFSSGVVATVVTILFTDFKGFSTLSEAALPSFWEGVMGVVAEVLDAHESEVECRNSWGDAVYAIVSTPEAGARCALARSNCTRMPSSLVSSCSAVTNSRVPATLKSMSPR